MTRSPRLLPLGLTVLVVSVFALYLLSLQYRKDRANSEGFDLETLRSLPVLEGGRVKPLDTVARNTLRIISGSDEYEDAQEKKQPAIKWLADVMFMQLPSPANRNVPRSGPAWQARIFRIDNEQLVLALGLPIRPGLRYSLAEFYERRDRLQEEADKANRVPEKKRDAYQAKAIELGQHFSQFERIAAFHVSIISPTEPGAPWQSVHDRRRILREDKEWMQSLQDRIRERIWQRHNLDNDKIKNLAAERLDQLMAEFSREMDDELARADEADPVARPWLDLRQAYRADDKESFNSKLAALATPPSHVAPNALEKIPVELTFNKVRPFFQCAGMYVVTMVLSLAGLMLLTLNPNWTRLARWPAFGLMTLAFVVHTAGIVTRIYLQGRPPVTNLYSSAIFIGWGAVLTCLIVELIYSYGVSTFVGGLLGFGTCVIAHFLSLTTGDTLEMMQAVLDTNFWLATHVVLVTFGYVATYVSGIFAAAFIILGLGTRLLDRKFFQDLSNIIYGVICFATMLSFIGTVLGGIWADQSWGRFWGWDPKENGAVLVVIWNAMILHARWAGLVQQRGIAALAVLGIIVTTWSWFGTNMLGVGLHAYGFSSFGMWMMNGSILTCVPLSLAAALIPARKWRSFGDRFDASNRESAAPVQRERELARVD